MRPATGSVPGHPAPEPLTASALVTDLRARIDAREPTVKAWAWLDRFLSTEKLKELLPEAAELRVDRHRLPAIRSLNFVLHGLLQEGVAASTRQDPQAKSLGEWLRARVVDLPEALLS